MVISRWSDVQREQLDHLIEAIDLAGVELGVIPLRAPMAVALLSGFRLLDSELVFVESLTGEQVLTGAEAITPVIEAFEVLRAAAADEIRYRRFLPWLPCIPVS